MAIGRVKINGNEKWVGFIGAGYNNDGDPNRGKGFFVVDLSNGNILWSYTRGNRRQYDLQHSGLPGDCGHG